MRTRRWLGVASVAVIHAALIPANSNAPHPRPSSLPTSRPSNKPSPLPTSPPFRVALLTLVEYGTCKLPPWGSYSLHSWMANIAMAKFFLISNCFDKPHLEPWFSDSGIAAE